MQINSVLKTHMANGAALLRARVIRLHVCWFIYFLICVYIYLLFCPSGCLYLLVRKSIIHTYVFMPVHMCTMHMWHLSIQVSNYIQSNLSVSVSIIYIKCGVDLYWIVHTRVCLRDNTSNKYTNDANPHPVEDHRIVPCRVVRTEKIWKNCEVDMDMRGMSEWHGSLSISDDLCASSAFCDRRRKLSVPRCRCSRRAAYSFNIALNLKYCRNSSNIFKIYSSMT